MRRTLTFLLVTAVLGQMAGCNQKKHDPQPSASASAAGSVVVNALESTSPFPSRRPYVPAPTPSMVPIPTGPRLAILPGKGVGPIRIGATVKTIERHMDLPCDVVTKDLCRYIGRAVDFHLKNGVVESLTVHRRDRPAGKDRRGKERVFGIFNGGFPPDFEVMMKQHVIEEHLGPPLRTEAVKSPNAFRTEQRDYYDGMVVEYDRYDNGQMVLGGVRIERSPGAKPAPSAQP